MGVTENEQRAALMERLESEEALDQPCWSFIKEMNSESDERLDSVAVRDGYRAYTYRQVFRKWERYAEAFSGVGITGENNSRVMFISTPSAEAIFALYGMNMTGAAVSIVYPLDLYDEKQSSYMFEREGITDLVISEMWAFPLEMKRLLREKESLGLRNVIVLESPMGGEFAVPLLEVFRNTNTAMFRDLPGGLVMEDLLKEYDGCPISYGKNKSRDDSIILHTTGTVNGMHKPVPLSDKALNAFIPSAIKAKEAYDDFQGLPDHIVSAQSLNMSWVYAMVDMVHMPLGLGMEVVCIPWGGTNPRYGEAIERYGFNVMFTSMSILDSWLKSMPKMDLSSVKVVFMGGTYISPEYKQQFNDYLKKCGSTARVVNGYGLSEMGGACIIAPSDRDDDAIGFPLPGYKVKLYVEDEGEYYDLVDGPRTGVLHLSSKTMSSGRIGEAVFFELVDIDGDRYLNTNDLVRVNEDGSMTCIGRSNQYFVNNSGIRFDAGLVQTAITAQSGIVACGVVPEFHKMIHDNVPVLYVETDKQGPAEVATVHRALVEAFVHGDTLADTNMPSSCVIVEKIPLNSGGKVNISRLASGAVAGKRFSVKPVKLGDKVADVMLIPATEGEDALISAGVPEELENDPYNILSELFAAIPDINDGDYGKILRIPGLRELFKKLTGFDIFNISGSMLSMTPKMLDMAFRKYIRPIMKGEKKMSKKTKKAAFPMLPPLPAFGVSEWPDWDWDWGWGKSAIKSNWEKSIDRQKSYIDGSKDQYDRFFENMSDMLDSFAESLPEDLPWTPWWFDSPVDFREAMKEWEDMANDYLKEIADSWTELAIKTQEKACEQIPEDAEEAEEQDEVIEAKVVEKKATKATTAKATATEAKPAARAKEAKPAARAKEAKLAAQAKTTRSTKAAK